MREDSSVVERGIKFSSYDVFFPLNCIMISYALSRMVAHVPVVFGCQPVAVWWRQVGAGPNITMGIKASKESRLISLISFFNSKYFLTFRLSSNVFLLYKYIYINRYMYTIYIQTYKHTNQ